MRASRATIVIGRPNSDHFPTSLGSDGEKKARYGESSSFTCKSCLYILEVSALSTTTKQSNTASSSRSPVFPAGGVYLDCVLIPPVSTAGYTPLPKIPRGPSIPRLEASVKELQEDIEICEAIIQSHLVLLRSAKVELRRIENQLEFQYGNNVL